MARRVQGGGMAVPVGVTRRQTIERNRKGRWSRLLVYVDMAPAMADGRPSATLSSLGRPGRSARRLKAGRVGGGVPRSDRERSRRAPGGFGGGDDGVVDDTAAGADRRRRRGGGGGGGRGDDGMAPIAGHQGGGGGASSGSRDGGGGGGSGGGGR